MTQRSVTYLRGRFENGDIPTETDYGDVFDSFVNLETSADQTLSGRLVTEGLTTNLSLKRNVQSILPTGETQASAVAVTADIIMSSAEQNERSIILPSLEPGRVNHIFNTGTTALLVFPPSGENFVGSAANGAVSVPTLSGIIIPHLVSAYGFIR